MSRALKRTLFAIGGAVGFLVLVALAVLLFGDVNRYKHRLEVAASDALGMEFRVGGRVGMGFLPGFRVTAEDCRILSEQGGAVASAKKVSLWIEPLPLLRRDFRLRRIELTQPRFFIERDPGGRIHVERLKWVEGLLGALDGGSLSLSNGAILCADGSSGEGLQVTGFDLEVSRIRLAGGRGPQLWKGLSLQADLACGEIRTKTLTVSDLKVSVDGKDSVFELKPVTMRIFGGQMAGSFRADVSGPIPLYQVRCSLPQFRIEEFLKTLSPEAAGKGAMDFSAGLSMQGGTLRQMVRTAAGEMSLRGENLILEGNDLDRGLSRFESSQSFNLVDVGAVFFAGPLSLVVTRGYGFASLFRGSGGTSKIRTLVSDWRIERGVAQAKDVALATTKNRIALQGGLDFVNGRFADVTVAVIDAEGCARAHQAIHGSFAKPVVEKPRILKSLAGPVRKLFGRVRGLFPAGPCEVFYSGSVAPPR
jgi:AsmA protein